MRKMADVPISLVEDVVLTAVRARLGHSIHINPSNLRHRIRVIVRLGRAFELCKIEVVSLIGFWTY